MPLSEDELSFVTFVHQHHALTGQLLTAELAKEEYGFPKTFFAKCMTNPDVTDALTERGIELRRYHATENNWESKALTPTQLLVANAMLDITDTRSDKKKLQDFNVSTGQYQSWLRDPVFSEYLANVAERLLKGSTHDAHLALLDKVKLGDTKALAIYYEMTGRFVSSAGRGSAESAVINLQQMIIRIVEIIQEEIEDPKLAARISDRLEALTMGATLAGVPQQVEDNTPQALPEPAPKRVMSEDLQHLIDTGQGVNS